MNKVIISSLLLLNIIFSYNTQFRTWLEKLDKVNPYLKMQKEITAAEKAKRSSDFLLPDLKTKVHIMDNGAKYTFSQMIPFPTKIIAKTASLKHSYLSAKEKYKQQKISIISVLKMSYLNVFFLDSIIKIQHHNLTLLEQIENQVSVQVISGKLPTTKLLGVQIEKLKLQDSISRLSQDKVNAINILINIMSYNLTIKEIESSLSNVNIPTHDLDDIDIDSTIKSSSDYLAAKHSLATAKAIKYLSYNSLLPDIMLKSEYATGVASISPNDEFKLMLKMQVPITVFKKAGEFRMVKHLTGSKDAALSNTVNQLKTIFLNTLNDYKKDKNSYELYKGPLKQISEQNFIEIQSKYISSGNITSVDFLEAFRKLLNIEIMIIEYQISMEKNIINLEKLSSLPIEEMKNNKKQRVQ